MRDNRADDLIRINPTGQLVVGRTREGLNAFIGIVIDFTAEAPWRVVCLLFTAEGEFLRARSVDLGPASKSHRQVASKQVDAWCHELGLQVQQVHIRPFDQHGVYGVSLRELRLPENGLAREQSPYAEAALLPGWELRMGDNVFWIDGHSGELTDT